MLGLFAKKNINEDVIFMDKCLTGLATALRDPRCNAVLESRLFAFGSTGKPLPVYQLRTDVLNQRASPFQIIQSSTGSGKTIMFPVFLQQLKSPNSPIRRIFVTQPTTMTMQTTMQTLKTKISGKEVPVSKNTKADAGIIFCTPV